MTVQEFLSRFDNAKKTGDQWLVKCPAHEDRKASLAVRAGDDGRILLHDHGGCSTDEVVAALGLTDADLFERPTKSSLQILETYDYTDGAGELLYQVCRMEPKDFRQRRRGKDNRWVWNLQGVQRVLYRLPELKGWTTVFVVEGEKDANALWARGIPATTNAGGAGKWVTGYTDQLRQLGVKKVAILPDNDVPGRQHAEAVAKSLTDAHIEARIVALPDLADKGDVSDYLAAGRTKDELLDLVRQAPLWTGPTPSSREFTHLDDGRYVLKVSPEGVIFELDRLGLRHHETWGELSVSVNGTCPDARAIEGYISSGDFNLSSIAARETRAKVLAGRSGNSELDWSGMIEELCVRVLKTERQGAESVRFADLDETTPVDQDTPVKPVGGFPIYLEEPNAIFGDPESAKSYFAGWLAGELAKDFPVLYADWELNQFPHLTRLRRLFQPIPRDLHYINCANPLVRESDRIRRLIHKFGIRFVVCDSVGPACFGRPEEAEHANAYIREVRGWKVGTLHLAHVSKRDSDDTERTSIQKMYGSMFWTANMRSIWYVKKAENNPKGQIQFGLYHTKNNFGEHSKPLSYTLVFEHNRSRFTTAALEDNDELAARLPLLDRMKASLKPGAMSVKGLADELGVNPGAVRSMMSRHKKVFERVDDKKVRLVAAGEERF